MSTLAGLLVAGLSVPAFAQSVPFPTYVVGPQPDGSYVVSDGTIIEPVGTQVDLGIKVRAKAIAVNPKGNHTAAVLNLGTSTSNGNAAIEIFNTQTGAVLQSYASLGNTDSHGSEGGITYTPDGKYLLFSQDSSYVAIAKVDPTTGLLSDYAHVSVPIDGNPFTIAGQYFDTTVNTVTCFHNSPPGTDGSYAHSCGHTLGTSSAYPIGIAVSPNGKTAYVVLDVNDTLTKIDLTASTPTEGEQIRVGNVPDSVVISADGKTAYVSNKGGRIAKKDDFQEYSAGTPVVADSFTGSASSGTVSVVDLKSFTVTATITTGLHPTGLALWGKYLLVSNTYSDTISVIDTGVNHVVRTINLGLPIRAPGEKTAAYGAGPNSIAVDSNQNLAYVALYNANAIAVVDLNSVSGDAILGLIPTAYAPSSVALDHKDGVLIVANDKGIGTTGIPPQNSLGTAHGVSGLNTHQDLGTVSIIP
ncbi:MAG: YncE family protein, partial [Mycobacterium sp.]|nr:YncE family protein [Mycobacterium sp.]